MLAHGSYVLAGTAGLLSILSPCVLPLVPIIAGSAAAAHRNGPVALAAGVALSFVATGLFVATIGFSIGLDGDVFRLVAAALMLGFGLILLSGAAQQRFAVAGARVGSFAEGALSRIAPEGLRGQFLIGLLLGVVWVPCVGPTLGAAATLAAQRSNLGQVSLVMILFGLGAAAPLVVIGTLSREALRRWRGRIASAGSIGKVVLGGFMLLIGAAILSGADHHIEAYLVGITPAWLTDLTTRF
jgi:cytochrome c-type biogenesis protein